MRYDPHHHGANLFAEAFHALAVEEGLDCGDGDGGYGHGRGTHGRTPL